MKERFSKIIHSKAFHKLFMKEVQSKPEKEIKTVKTLEVSKIKVKEVEEK